MAALTRKHYAKFMKAEFRYMSFYRDLLAEFISTFLLTMSATSLGMTWGDKPDTGTALHVAIGMMCTVCSLAWSLGEFGGIHMNPSVTFAMVLLLEMTLTKAFLYVCIQCAAAILGTMIIQTILPPLVTTGMVPTMLHPDVTAWQGFLIEVWLTCLLMLAVLGSTDGTRKPDGLYVPPVIISMTVAACVSAGVASTGCSMNPALTFGPAVATNTWDDHWVYWAGPLTGSALATLLYKVIFDMADNQQARPRTRAGVYTCDPSTCAKGLDRQVSCESTSIKHFRDTQIVHQVTPVGTPRLGDKLRRRRVYSMTGEETESPLPRTRGLYS